jgi:hypothetical protein
MPLRAVRIRSANVPPSLTRLPLYSSFPLRDQRLALLKQRRVESELLQLAAILGGLHACGEAHQVGGNVALVECVVMLRAPGGGDVE